eukprot:1689494-Karenia_brevis.AAC.1
MKQNSGRNRVRTVHPPGKVKPTLAVASMKHSAAQSTSHTDESAEDPRALIGGMLDADGAPGCRAAA